MPGAHRLDRLAGTQGNLLAQVEQLLCLRRIARLGNRRDLAPGVGVSAARDEDLDLQQRALAAAAPG